MRLGALCSGVRASFMNLILILWRDDASHGTSGCSFTSTVNIDPLTFTDTSSYDIFYIYQSQTQLVGTSNRLKALDIIPDPSTAHLILDTYTLMPVFSQIDRDRGFSEDIDEQFPSAIRYLDELHRHFSNHHRFMNRFIPRFDLTEDDHFYCELPGAKADYITIEPSNDHTLRIYGIIRRLNSGLPSPDQNSHTCKETEV